ncbi:MAG TPA: hypothetical protein VJ724_11220, partial [Tahibacter sp.]|nr:hypothetical protein [Tahibacter sp.]
MKSTDFIEDGRRSADRPRRCYRLVDTGRVKYSLTIIVFVGVFSNKRAPVHAFAGRVHPFVAVCLGRTIARSAVAT